MDQIWVENQDQRKVSKISKSSGDNTAMRLHPWLWWGRTDESDMAPVYSTKKKKPKTKNPETSTEITPWLNLHLKM